MPDIDALKPSISPGTGELQDQGLPALELTESLTFPEQSR